MFSKLIRITKKVREKEKVEGERKGEKERLPRNVKFMEN